MRFDKLIHSFLLKTSSDHCAGAMRLGFDVHSSGSCYLQQKKPFLPFFQGYGPKGPQRSLSFLAHFLPLLCLLPIPPERLGFYFESTWTKNIGGPWKWKSAIAANCFCLAYKVCIFWGPLHVVWQVSFGCWITWSISSWQKHYKCVFFPKAEWWVATAKRNLSKTSEKPPGTS